MNEKLHRDLKLLDIFCLIMEWKKKNTFGTTAFTSYGLFWMSFAALLIIPALGLASAPEGAAMGWYLFMWGLFTAVMLIATLRINRTLQFVFGSLALLFFLLSAAEFTGSALIGTIAGYEGIICGLSAVYGGLAQVINEVYGKAVCPL